VQIDRIWSVNEGKLLLHRIPDDAQQLAGQYELPATTHFKGKTQLDKALTTKTRGITNKRIKETIYRLKPQTSALTLQVSALKAQSSNLHWIALDELEHVTLSGPHRRWVNELLKQDV
jgi:A/G-specific adenine glycosylase